MTVRTAWGGFDLLPTETRLLSPYFGEPLEVALVARLLLPGMTVIDIGANRGWFTLLAAARVGAEGRVVAVEPDPRLIRRLESTVARNRVGDRVALDQAAVAARSGLRQMVWEAEPSLNYLVDAGDGPATAEPIHAVSFTELVCRHGLRAVDLVKIDVEGAEPEVLASVADAMAKGLAPPVLMFEHEPRHWARAGFPDPDAALAPLRATYRLFAIDYRSGGPVEVATLRSEHGGRNVLAIPGDHVEAVLSRITTRPAGARSPEGLRKTP